MIQFIVSTHSPFIVQSLQKNQLISFDENVMIEGEPYRESLEDITADRMGLEQNIRSKRFQEMQEIAKITSSRYKKEKKTRNCWRS